MAWRRPTVHRVRREPVLGTVLDLQIRAPRRRDAEEAERVLLVEIARLDEVFNVFRDSSELSRWRSGTLRRDASGDLVELLELGLQWQERSGGTFNPAVGEATALWQRAAARNQLPSPAELAVVAARLAEPRYTVVAGVPEPVGDCSALNFNALAKGLVVERACARVAASIAVDELLVNVGGDLRHVGQRGVVVAVDNPSTPFDNAAPLARVRVRGEGFATSGSSRRGVRIGGRWLSHVIDPRTATPVERVASASVKAPDAATADVVATVLSVREPTDGVAFATAGGWAACVVGGDGSVLANAAWDAAVT